MPNLAYNRGVNFERAVVKHYQDRGYMAARFAGSKGFHDYAEGLEGFGDCIAINQFGLAHIISAKHTKKQIKSLTAEQKKEFAQRCADYHCIPVIAVKVRKCKMFPEGMIFEFPGAEITHII